MRILIVLLSLAVLPACASFVTQGELEERLLEERYHATHRSRICTRREMRHAGLTNTAWSDEKRRECNELPVDYEPE